MMIIYEELCPCGGKSNFTRMAFAFPNRWPKQEININPRGTLAPNQ